MIIIKRQCRPPSPKTPQTEVSTATVKEKEPSTVVVAKTYTLEVVVILDPSHFS